MVVEMEAIESYFKSVENGSAGQAKVQQCVGSERAPRKNSKKKYIYETTTKSQRLLNGTTITVSLEGNRWMKLGKR